MYYDWPVAESAQGKYYEYPPYHRHEHRHEEHRVRAVVVLCAQREGCESRSGAAWRHGPNVIGAVTSAGRRRRTAAGTLRIDTYTTRIHVRHTGTSDRHSATTPSYRPLPEAVRHPGEPHEHREHDREQQYHHVHGAHLIPRVLTCKRGSRALVRRRRPRIATPFRAMLHPTHPFTTFITIPDTFTTFTDRLLMLRST